MIRTSLVITLVAVFMFSGFGTAQAATRERTGTTTTPSTTSVACVGTAVVAREASIMSALTTYTTAITSAYSIRKSSLTTIYSGSYTVAQIKEKLKGIWSEFRTDTKSARQAWNTAQRSAWSTYRTAVKACRASGDVTDTSNSSMELSGS